MFKISDKNFCGMKDNLDVHSGSKAHVRLDSLSQWVDLCKWADCPSSKLLEVNPKWQLEKIGVQLFAKKDAKGLRKLDSLSKRINRLLVKGERDGSNKQSMSASVEKVQKASESLITQTSRWTARAGVFLGLIWMVMNPAHQQNNRPLQDVFFANLSDLPKVVFKSEMNMVFEDISNVSEVAAIGNLVVKSEEHLVISGNEHFII